MLHRTGRSLGESGQVAAALDYVRHLSQTTGDRLGPDNSDTLFARNYLAYWLGVSGDAAGAATAFEQLLDDRLRVLGPDHPDTLTTERQLAYWRDAQ